jgi:hypothetical protein
MILPTLAEHIQAVNEFERCGRWVAAGLAIVKLRERFDDFVAAGEITGRWEEFCRERLAFGPERAAQLLGRLYHFRGILKCSACGQEVAAPCSCGAAYRPARWPVEPVADPVTVHTDTALNRAIVAIGLDPARSNRAIAKEIGVSEPTVRRARRELANTLRPDAFR